MKPLIQELLKRFEALEKKTEQHLSEASGVRTEIAWLKNMVWLLLSVELASVVSIIVEHLLK